MRIDRTKSLADRRRTRVRSKLFGTAVRPRVSVLRSNKYISVQVINDDTGSTVASVTELSLLKAKEKLVGTKTEKAVLITQKLVAQLKDKKITKLCFDRGQYRYHGRVKAVAETLRQAGLEV